MSRLLAPPFLLPLFALAPLALGACGPTPSTDAGPEEEEPTIAVTGGHSVEAGDTVTLTAATTDGTDASYTWTSGNAAVATVDTGGVVTGVAVGETVITATGADTGAKGTHVIVVTAAPIAPAAVVTVMGDHRVLLGETLTLTAMTVNGTDATYTWTSSNITIATVDDGVVTPAQPGEVTITATGVTTGASGTFAVVAVQPVVTPDVSVTISGPYYVGLASTGQLTATTLNGTDATYTWSSSDENVATVSATGLVTGVTAGPVVITAVGDTSGAEGEIGVFVTQDVPNFDGWQSSGHNDVTAEAFNHWNEDGEVEVACAKCHSRDGYRDYLGDDGSAVGVVDAPAALGSTIDCVTCHNNAATALSTVTFPSGAVLTDLGAEARCMTCHQGNASTTQVDAAIATAAVADDETSTSLTFINIHYYAAGATLNAGRVQGGYQYADQVYDTRFRHVPERDTCIECHDAHTLEVRVNACQECHTAVTTPDDAKDIRMMSSRHADYNGNGNLDEGVYYEMTGLRDDVLFPRIRAYVAEKLATNICYDEHAYPYWFVDTDGSGAACAPGEAIYPNRFQSWTPRLLRAAYNFQVAKKDPGAFAHNAKYIMQLLYDASMDLNGSLTTPADLTALHRDDPGHFNGASEAARHWDEDEGVEKGCSRCHGASEGFTFYLTYGVGKTVLEQGDGMDCATCHATFGDPADEASYTTHDVDSILFPSGVTITRANEPSNLCRTCHQGNASQKTVDDAIALGPTKYAFKNVHYLPSASTAFGADVNVGYQFDPTPGAYAGEWTTHLAGNRCTDCHSPANTDHTFEVVDNLARCQECHATITELSEIRSAARSVIDYDNDGSATEPLADELATLAEALLEEINLEGGLCYDGHAYPYWFIDGNTSGGVCEPNEAIYPNRYQSWTPALMRTTFNYQMWSKDPGAWAHNFDYMAQLLIDAVDHLGGDVSGYIRP